ncbi:predicted protein [Pyrenophora tritici-repentis Pt-1C-BFP]|uniref:Uncharacterized protein n=1 Tax=Pyrenophora tritici-repentis (strain Pt-1C-BFP) TaxID=426418 RepID=B2VZ25_PYRTR|nr:uncharacterized protein PTRG_02665 [Pyrenophora tritici-repentis Pt-1C-BFP]EDU45188.1 predicted protein [Pyrenophora tritici-repentis Pt-1C-BFP]
MCHPKALPVLQRPVKQTCIVFAVFNDGDLFSANSITPNTEVVPCRFHYTQRQRGEFRRTPNPVIGVFTGVGEILRFFGFCIVFAVFTGFSETLRFFSVRCNEIY